MFLFVMSYVIMPYGNTVYNCCFGVGLSYATLSVDVYNFLFFFFVLSYKYLIE